jgi:hypothetical protein
MPSEETGIRQDARHNKTVVARLDRAIQYTAASRFYRWHLWNTGSPGSRRAMTVVFVSFIRVGPKAGTEFA